MKCIRLSGLLGLLIVLMVTAADCICAPEALETGSDFTGFITEIHAIRDKGTLGQIRVESPADNWVDKYMVTIKDETHIFKQIGEERRQVTFEALETEQRVQLWFTGPVMESFPMQATAQQVVIIETASTELTHRQLAEYWAPIWWQDTDDDDFRADYITKLDFDGDWDPLNNWNNLPQSELKAYIYYWVAETMTHWFIGYADFHPRDWSDDITAAWDQHENDMEGCLIVIQKDGGNYGQFVIMITRAHMDLYSFKDYDSSLSNKVKDGHEDIEGDVEFEEHHPYIYVKAEGHAVYGDLRWEKTGFPGGDGVVYRYTGQAEEPQNGNDRDVGYDLVDISELWTKKHDPDIFYKYGTFRGDDWGENKANAPWRWDDKDDGEVYADQLFVDPAYLVDYYHDGLGDFSHDYISQFQNEGMIIFHSENEGKGTWVGEFTDDKFQCIYLKEDDRWPNDEARSVTFISVQEGTKVKIYDSPAPDQSQRMQEDDWAEITVTKLSETTVIPTFELTYSDTYVNVVYNEMNGLDGKISTIEIIPPD